MRNESPKTTLSVRKFASFLRLEENGDDDHHMTSDRAEANSTEQLDAG